MAALRSISIKLTFTALLFMACYSHGQAQIVFSTESYDSLAKEAQDSQKLVFIDFRADWCRPCKLMESTTFKDSTLADFVNKNFISYKADTDFKKNHKLKRKYRINALPTLVVIDPNNPDEVLLRVIGYTPAHILLDDLKGMRNSEGDKIFH